MELNFEPRFVLRPFQRELVGRALESMEAGQRVLLQAPTGAGKTDMALSLAEEFLERGYSVIWLVHRAELCLLYTSPSPRD